ncbi:MAG: SOS response-associated peptidase [Lentimicrobium sp.]|nr:SOS response-associated peptidase [Lentimicrobium sp.]
MIHTYILASNLETIETHFGSKASPSVEWEAPLVVSAGDTSLIITQQNPAEFTLSTFGLTPAWAKSKIQLINARAEGDKNPENNPDFKGSKAIFLKPAFQKPLFLQRCIVIADAYIDRQPGIFLRPYLFYLREHRHPLGFAGLYDIWKDPFSLTEHHSFTIITVAANALVRSLPSSRMPVILPYGQESRWLKQTLSLAEILRMLVRHPSKQMNAWPVSNQIDQSGSYSKDMLKPVGPKLWPEEFPSPLKVQSHYGHKKKPDNNTRTLGELANGNVE